jgi:hypothetical protein
MALYQLEIGVGQAYTTITSAITYMELIEPAIWTNSWILNIHAGTYNEEIGASSDRGTATNTITIQANGSDVVIIDGQNTRQRCSQASYSSYITFKNLRFRNYTQWGFYSYLAYGDITFDGCNIISPSGAGCMYVAYWNGTSKFIIQNCYLENLVAGNYVYSNASCHSDVLNNTIVAPAGTNYFNTPKSGTYRGNSFLNCNISYLSSIGMTIERNFLNTCSVSGYAGGSNNIIRNNIFYYGGIFLNNACNNNKIYNNSFYKGSIFETSNNSLNNEFKNNAIYTDNYYVYIYDTSTCVIDYNCVYTTGSFQGYYQGTYYNSWSAWKTGTGQDVNSVNSNPLFVAVGYTTPEAYKLTSSSPCIKKALSMASSFTDDYFSRYRYQWDIGAHNWSGDPVLSNGSANKTTMTTEEYVEIQADCTENPQSVYCIINGKAFVMGNIGGDTYKAVVYGSGIGKCSASSIGICATNVNSGDYLLLSSTLTVSYPSVATTTIFSRLKTMFLADSGLTGYLQAVYINLIDQFALIPDVATPCIVLNDAGEEFEPVSPQAIAENPMAEVKRRVYKVEVYCVLKYDSADAVIVGDAVTLGIVQFSKLVENAIRNNESLSSAYHELVFGQWEASVINRPDAPQVAFAVARRVELRYLGKPEAL